MSEAQKAYGKDALFPVKDWARRYGDMLDGADEAPTLNELYEAIDEDRKRSWQTGADAYARGFDEGFASADDWIFQHEGAMRDHGWVKDSRDRRDLLDEIAWLHSELHGAEMEAERLRKKPATPPPTMPEQPPYDLLIDLLRDEWGIEACWDGLRRFWHIGLTEGEVRVREALEAENVRLRSCLEDAAENERLTTHEFDQLREERDKLRELVRDVVLLAGIAGCDVAGMQMHVHGGDWRTVRERMEELGAEV